jgi:tetratricopeptide (TPR) repeat protein
MNLRLFIRPVLALLLTPCVSGQRIYGAGSEPACAATNVLGSGSTAACEKADANALPGRTEVFREIAKYEAAARKAESAHETNAVVATMYMRLASLYEDAGMHDQSEAALERSISLLRRNAEWSGQLAEGLSLLGLLHGEMGKLRLAEKEELEALRLRESLGNSFEIARSWNSLAGLYLIDHKYTLARDFARRAMDEFLVSKQPDVGDRISSRFNLAMALCYTKDYPSAIPLLKDGIDIAKAAFQPNDFPIGIGEFLLGFVYWKSGNLSDAGQYMEQGTAIMKGQLGWGHPTYLHALRQYALFLRTSKRVEDASAVEREIRLAEAVVDVHSIQMPKDASGLAGLR